MKNPIKQKSNNLQKRWVVELLENTDITPATKAVGTTLYLMWWKEDAEIFPSNKSIMAATGLSKMSVTRAVKELVNEGFVTTAGEKSVVGVSYRYTPHSSKQFVKDAAQAIADDYLNPKDNSDETYNLNLDTMELVPLTHNLLPLTHNLEQVTHNLVLTYPQDEGVSNKEVIRNNNEVITDKKTAVKDNCLDSNDREEVKEVGVSYLDSKTARSEQGVVGWLAKSHKRQDDINDGFRKMMAGGSL